MVKKCCVYGCRTNYLSEKKKENTTKIPVFRFPKNEDDRERWKHAIPNSNLTVKDDTVVCELHWPKDYEKTKIKGRMRPKHPPSVWADIPSSQIPTALPPPRKTQKVTSASRNPDIDEFPAFVASDCVSFDSLRDCLLNKNRKFKVPLICFLATDVLYAQSDSYANGVPNFLIKVYPNLNFEAFYLGIRCTIPALVKNRIKCINAWSVFEEIVNFLTNFEVNQHNIVMQEHITEMGPKRVGFSLYSMATIVRAFEYFATSRSLYKRLRVDYKLPSIKTLSRITSKVSKLSESTFLQKVMKSLEANQKQCIVLHDEIYVKKMLLYHGGSLFGKAMDDPASLAKTVLGIMVSCLHGGPKFLTKMLPISRLNSHFLQQELELVVKSLQEASGQVKAIISDANRNNQAFFKLQDTVEQKPWLKKDGTFLLFDFVHLLKNIRNNWLTEKTAELVFFVDGTTKIAKWCHLQKLYKLECDTLVTLSNLNFTAVFPKPIERQNVSTCLRVFCEKTYLALLNHPGMRDIQGKEETAEFINIVCCWWKILNVKGPYLDARHNDFLQAVISDPNDKRLDTVLQFGEMALQMAGKQGKRIKQLTKDTAYAIHHTCCGLVDLCKSMLNDSKYVALGQFTTDPLEKEFGKLRQGSGGAYFLTVQQIIEKCNISKAALMLSVNVDVAQIDIAPAHCCEKCSFQLNETDIEVFDSLPQLEESVPAETIIALVYICGYVSRHDEAVDEYNSLMQTTFYFQKFGDYTKSMDRGGLKIPTDNIVQWAIFCFIMFNTVKQNVCRVSMINLMMLISEHYGFIVKQSHGRTLSNIFFNNFCKCSTPRSCKEPALKMLKLS